MRIKENKYDFLILFFVAIVLILLATFRTPGIDRDSLVYIDMINRPISELWFQEPSFTFIIYINRYLFNNSHVTFFFIYAFLGVILKLIAINKIDKYKYFGLLSYFFLYFALHDLTQIRVGVASGFFLLSVYFIDKSKFKAVLCSSFSIIFHYSAIFGIFIYIVSKAKINKYIYGGFILLSLLMSKLLTKNLIIEIASYFPDFLSYKVYGYINMLNDTGQWSEINQFNIYYLCLIIMVLFSLFFSDLKSYDKGYNNVLVLKVMSVMIISYYILVPVPVLAGRVSEFYGIVLICFIPQFLAMFKVNRYFINVIIFVFFVLFYRGVKLNYEIILEELIKRI